MIIGLLGRAGSGKTTAANYIVERYGGKKFSLADPLKRIARDVFGFSDAQLWGSTADKEAIDPRYGFSPRWLLQRLGTEGIRQHLGQDVWVRTLLDDVAAWRHAGGEGFVVVDDVRFKNEATFLRTQSVEPAWIVRFDRVGQSAADPSHASEAEVGEISVDHVVHSDGIADMRRKIDDFITARSRG